MAREMKVSVTIHIVAVVLASYVAPCARADYIFGPIENPSTGHSYYLLDATVWDIAGFTASEADAQLLGGHLASIENAAEDAWIFATFGPLLGHPAFLGIGLNDIAVEGTYEWTDGSPVSYTNWDPLPGGGYGPQPDGIPDDVVGIAIGVFTSGAWHDLNTDLTDGVASAGVFPLVKVRAIPEPNSFSIVLLTAVLALKSRRRC